MTGSRRVLTVLTALAMVVAACGDDGDTEMTDTVPTAAPTTTEATTTTTGPGAADAEDAMVEVASSELGEILVSNGMTLYLFTPDDAGAPTCYDQCAQTWPPLVASGDVTTGAGLDEALLGTVPRDDGGEQVTVNGWPLYFFANDAEPGDTNGQGIGDNWWVVAPDGEPIGNA